MESFKILGFHFSMGKPIEHAKAFSDFSFEDKLQRIDKKYVYDPNTFIASN